MAGNSSRPQANRGYSAPLLSRAPSSSAALKTPTDSEGYFSPQAPSSISASLSPPVSSSPYTPVAPPYPVITATVTSRNPSGTTTTTSSVTTPEQNALSQFAMHIPIPPTLSLTTSSRQYHHPGPQVHPVSYSNSRPGSTPGYEDLPSPMDRSRRMPPTSNSPQMQIASSTYHYTLSVQLPSAIQPEMVTVCANKGDKIKVVADVWHMENESTHHTPLYSLQGRHVHLFSGHYEWSISFPPHDIDMGAVHARFDDSRNLFIDVRRIPRMYRT